MTPERLADLRFVLDDLVPQEPVPWEVARELLWEVDRLSRLLSAAEDLISGYEQALAAASSARSET